MKLIAGLGNPGIRYGNTRHNMGYLVVDELARRHDLRFRKGRLGDSCRLGQVTLFKPSTYMNSSGTAVQSALTSVGAQPGELLVVHDDLDMPLGRLRFKRGGGAGGQRGVQDVIALVGPEFWRLKLGISRPPTGWKTENWVLSRFRPEEAELLSRVVIAAATALDQALEQGIESAMNDTNGLDLALESQ
ncbi:MAG TPA: aminoacyl-tRNA hydrolase [Trueperaceae bacterium]